MPLTPGGSPDTIARALAQGLQGVWPQPVVVENRTGGSQNIGSDLVAKSPPDGYTWLLAPDNVFSVNPLPRQAAVRSAHRPGAGDAGGAHPVPAGGESRRAGQVGAGAGRAREGEAGRAELRLLRQRQPAAPRRHHVPAADRHQDEPRALQGRGTGDRRPAARAHPGLDRRGEHHPAARQGRQAAPARQQRAERFPNLGDTPTIARNGVPAIRSIRGSACSCRRRPRRTS